MNRDLAWRMILQEADRAYGGTPSFPERVRNSSFEQGKGILPDGWMLHSGQDSTQWKLRDGSDGNRCLWLTPQQGGASWVSSPVPVEEGIEYLFRCAMKRDGLRHWAHACAASWVSLVFLNASQKPVREDPEHDQPVILVRCRKTADWVQAQKIVRAPKGACFLQIGFKIDRGVPDLSDLWGFRRFWHSDIDSGQWWIDDVSIERIPIRVSEDRGALVLQIPERGARIRVVREDGTAYVPDGAVSYSEGGGCFHCLHTESRLHLRPGRYTIEAMRGFDHVPFQEQVSIGAGEEKTVPILLARNPEWASSGWIMGDHHCHLSFHGATRHPLLSIDEVCQIARGEGLSYLSFCGEIVDQHAYADWRDQGRPPLSRPDGAFESDDFVCAVSHEVTQDLLGHVCLVQAPGHVQPGHPWWMVPTNADMAEIVRKSDSCGTVGAVALAHPYDGLTLDTLFQVLADPTKMGLQRELPVDVILGYADTMDFLVPDNAANLDLRFQDYFRLLNLGLDIGVSAASDVYADQGTEIVGGVRTVVRPGAFSMNAVATAYRQRRTQATNGPLLLFSIGDALPGDTVTGTEALLQAKAFSYWGLTRLEIIAGGEVVAEASPGSDGWARIELSHPLDRSQWFVARAFGPGHPSLNVSFVSETMRPSQGQCAITSPIHVTVPGRPIVPKAENIDYFLQWIDASCEAIRLRMAVVAQQSPHGPDMKEEHVQRALDLFARGRKAFEALR